MSLENQLAELKYDYVRLQGDLEKRESLNLDTSALVRQLKILKMKLETFVLKCKINNLSFRQ